MNLGDILSFLTNYAPTGREPDLSSVVVDSRQVQAGSLFVAFDGENADGHSFVEAAFLRGAVAALVERPLPGTHQTIDARSGHIDPDITLQPPVCIVVDNTMLALQQAAKAWRRRFPSLRVIGITGSVGKTTTKEMIAAVLAQRYRTLKSPGNRNNEIGLPLTLLSELRPYHECAVLEMGMYTTGEISLLCEIAEPQVGVLTIIGPVHLERVGSMEGIVKAKRELVEALPADGVAILNYDDERVMSMVPHTQARIFTYGLDPRADLWADSIRSMGLDGVGFALHHQGERLNVQVPMLGRHSVHTALRAAAVGLVEGLSWSEIVAGLNQTDAAQMRLVAVPGPRNSLIIDDTYNSSPDSALAALNLLEELDGRHIAVLGDMLELGQAETRSHQVVGRRAADVADVLIAIGPRSRTMADEAVKVGMPADRVYWVEDAETAVPLLLDLIREQDIILVKASLGMRLDRIVTALGSN